MISIHRLENQGQVLANTPYRKAREGETLGVGEDGILISFEEAKTLPEDQVMWRWARMSKSKGNVVTPDEAKAEYGADALRVYLLFVAPFNADIQWSSEGIQGSVRFLSRIFRLVHDFKAHYNSNWKQEPMGEHSDVATIRRVTHRTIAKVTSDIDRFSFNTAISALMIFLNDLSPFGSSYGSMPEIRNAMSEAVESLVLLLSPIAPHSADELWSMLGNEGFLFRQDVWPKANSELAAEDTITVAVQVNGKLRATLEMQADATKEALETSARENEKVQTHLEGKTLVKVVVVPGKLVNFVVR